MARHWVNRYKRISIHAPREGSDAPARRLVPIRQVFLSTLPARGATLCAAHCTQSLPFLSTLPARGATPVLPQESTRHKISIHAPREGSDKQDSSKSSYSENFYPRSPRGERPVCCCCSHQVPQISIHAPREGSDPPPAVKCAIYARISIHAPREGSDADLHPQDPHSAQFLSTLPARGATPGSASSKWPPAHFYPRSPRGERRQDKLSILGLALFLSTLPARGATFIMSRLAR